MPINFKDQIDIDIGGTFLNPLEYLLHHRNHSRRSSSQFRDITQELLPLKATKKDSPTRVSHIVMASLPAPALSGSGFGVEDTSSSQP